MENNEEPDRLQMKIDKLAKEMKILQQGRKKREAEMKTWLQQQRIDW